jgi:hypothetical protein
LDIYYIKSIKDILTNSIMELNEKETELSNIKLGIVIFDNKIYKIRNAHDSIWFYDYYKTKIDDDLRNCKGKEISTANAVFVLYLSLKTYLCFGNDNIKNNIELQKMIYKEVINSVKIIKDESEINNIHLDCLKNKIVKKLTEVITKEQILGREIVHMAYIKTYITDLLKVLADKLYVMADKGLTGVELRLDLLDEEELTQNKKIKIYYEQLKISTYKEYIIYLFSKEHNPPELMTDEIEWLGDIIIKQCKIIFPHINFIIKHPPKGAAFPIIVAKIDYKIEDALL